MPRNIEVQVVNGEAYICGCRITPGKRIALPWGSVVVEQKASSFQFSVTSNECKLYCVRITEDGLYVLEPKSGRRVMREERRPLDGMVQALMLPVHTLSESDSEICLTLRFQRHDGKSYYTRAFCSTSNTWRDVPQGKSEAEVELAPRGAVALVRVQEESKGRRVFLEKLYSFPGATQEELAYAYFRAVHELEHQPALELTEDFRRAGTTVEWMVRNLLFEVSDKFYDGFTINGHAFRLSDELLCNTPPQSIIGFLFNRHGSSILEEYGGCLQKPFLEALAEESAAVRWLLGEYSVETVDTDEGPVLCMKDAVKDWDIVERRLQNQERIKNGAIQLLLRQFPLLLFKLRAAAPRRRAEAFYPVIREWMLNLDYAWAGFDRGEEGVIFEPMYPANEVVMIPALDDRLLRASTLLSSSELGKERTLVSFLKDGEAAFVTGGANGAQAILLHLPDGSKKRYVMLWRDNEHRYAVSAATIERRQNDLLFTRGEPSTLFEIYVDPNLEDKTCKLDRVIVVRM